MAKDVMDSILTTVFLFIVLIALVMEFYAVDTIIDFFSWFLPISSGLATFFFGLIVLASITGIILSLLSLSGVRPRG